MLGTEVALWLAGPPPTTEAAAAAEAAGVELGALGPEPGGRGLQADVVLALGGNEPGLSLPVPAVAMLAHEAPPGVLGVTGEDAEELGDALAFVASHPDLRRLLRQEREGALPNGPWLVWGPFDSSFSLALVNRELALALTRLGLPAAVDGPIYRAGRAVDWAFLAHQAEALRALHTAAGTRPAVALGNDYPPQAAALPRAAVSALAGYAWEETGYPVGWVREFNWRLDLMTVVSPLTKKILRDAGVRRPIAVVGNGIDHLQSVPPVPMREGLGQAGRFRFLHVSSGLARKGVEAMLAAYGQAFTAADAVSLVIKTHPNEGNILYACLDHARAGRADYPEVVLIDRDLSAGEMAWLYEQCDALVLTAKAEGFGLPIAEAALAGLPPVTSAWGGQLGYLDESTAFLVQGRFAPSRSHLGIDDSLWFEPDVEHLAQTLRRAAGTPRSLLRSMAARLAERLRAHYTWDAVARRTRQAVQQVWQMPALPRQPRVAWLSTWDTRCGLATYSQHLSANWPAQRLCVIANRDASPLGQARADVQVERVWARGELPVARMAELISGAGCGALIAQHHPGLYPARDLGELARALAQRGIPCYVTLHNTAQLGDDAQSLRHCRRLLVHSCADMNRLLELGLADRATLFPHGIYPPPLEVRGDLVARAGLSGRRLIATFGFLMPHKGLYEVLCAFEQLAPRWPQAHLLMLNALYPAAISHAEHTRLVDKIERSGLRARVSLVTDFLPDEQALAWLAQAELAVFAYQYTDESASGAVRMAIAAGCPCLVSPLPIFDDVAAAVDYLQADTPEAIAAGVEAMLTRFEDPATRTQARGRVERFARAHQWPLLGERLLNLIDGDAHDPFPDGLLD
ncbi:MAG: glycosyltransferase [Burkholderiales bacterium]|nr:glycosyltransferase [Burkholderiales bacterium]